MGLNGTVSTGASLAVPAGPAPGGTPDGSDADKRWFDDCRLLALDTPPDGFRSRKEEPRSGDRDDDGPVIERDDIRPESMTATVSPSTSSQLLLHLL